LLLWGCDLSRTVWGYLLSQRDRKCRPNWVAAIAQSFNPRIGGRLAHIPAALEADLSGGVRLEANALSGSGYGNISLDLKKYQ